MLARCYMCGKNWNDKATLNPTPPRAHALSLVLKSIGNLVIQRSAVFQW